jgi:hypothetical protein
MAGCCQPDVLGCGSESGGDGADLQAGADERVQIRGAAVAGVGAGPGDAGDPVEWRFLGNGLVDVG